MLSFFSDIKSEGQLVCHEVEAQQDEYKVFFDVRVISRHGKQEQVWISSRRTQRTLPVNQRCPACIKFRSWVRCLVKAMHSRTLVKLGPRRRRWRQRRETAAVTTNDRKTMESSPADVCAGSGGSWAIDLHPAVDCMVDHWLLHHSQTMESFTGWSCPQKPSPIGGS